MVEVKGLAVNGARAVIARARGPHLRITLYPESFLISRGTLVTRPSLSFRAFIWRQIKTQSEKMRDVNNAMVSKSACFGLEVSTRHSTSPEMLDEFWRTRA